MIREMSGTIMFKRRDLEMTRMVYDLRRKWSPDKVFQELYRNEKKGRKKARRYFEKQCRT